MGGQTGVTNSLKVLGFRLEADVWSAVKGEPLRVQAQIKNLKLKKCGLTEKELVQVYVSKIRPVGELVCECGPTTFDADVRAIQTLRTPA